MKTISIDRIIVNPEFIEVFASISGLLSTFRINVSFVENRDLIPLSMQLRDKIEETIKNKYLKEDVLK